MSIRQLVPDSLINGLMNFEKLIFQNITIPTLSLIDSAEIKIDRSRKEHFTGIIIREVRQQMYNKGAEIEKYIK